MEQQRPVEPEPAREPGSGSDQESDQRQDHERAPESEGVLPPGLTARVELTVTDMDTAQAVGSGDVPVLGTPRVLALAEAATVAATARRLPAGMTTVGLRVELDHRAPTPVGRTVVAQARLAKVDGRRLLFEVNVTEGTTTVADGRVERVMVDRQRFIDRALGNS
jgi:predicted thioesterase